MGKISQNDLEYILGQVKTGKMTTSQANIEMIRIERFRISPRLDRETRATLNQAVKDGFLCHKKKNTYNPEVYYHPNFEHLVFEEFDKIALAKQEALRSICI